MLKLAKYLKPYLGLVLLCVVLVFFQAMSDLKLPDLMSDIVNVGVQRYGIEDAVPVRLSGETYGAMQLFMTADERAVAEKYYNGAYEYSAPEGVGKDAVAADRAVLDKAFSRGFIALSAIQRGMLPENIPAGTDVLALLAKMPEEQRSAAVKNMADKFDSLGETVVNQMSVLALKAEYDRIGVDVSALQRNAILKTGLKMLAMAALVAVCAVSAGLISSRVAASFARDVRDDVFKKATGFSSAEMNRFSTASLLTRTTNDVQQVQMVVTMMMRMVIYAPIMGVGGIIYALQKSVSMSWIIALAVGVLLLMMGVMFVLVLPKFKKLQKLIDRINRVTRENVSGIMVSRAYNTQEFEMQRFDAANKDVTRTNLFVNRAMVLTMPFMNVMMNAVMLMIVWFGAHQIAESAMQVGDMMAYMQYAMNVIMAFLFVGAMFIMIPRAAVSGDRIAEVLRCENSIADPKNPVSATQYPQNTGLIEFKNVAFRYPGAEKDTLSDISFTVMPGQTTAVIGATGSGKSTLASLIMRFYDVTAGSVEVNGVDVRQMTQHDLRGQIGFVPQKSVLFTGTIDENIRFGAPDATEEQIEYAAVTAQALEFIKAKDDGFGEHISQGGTNVSGGQRQRLSIARALATQAPILVFDDSFSALDFKTDALLRKALRERAAGSTMLIVAQRVGTIRAANQIIVLDEGKIVGIGTHGELMRTCDIYRNIAKSQLREEEL